VKESPKDFNITCPVPASDGSRILLAHGGGGKLMHRLIEKVFLKNFSSPLLAARHDGAVLELGGTKLAFTTDSYVVRPLFFPGGDIGSLAVNGTVNDLAMCGARPIALSAGFILEEGLAVETLQRVAESMRDAAAAAHVDFVTGDTKVVDRGKGDGIYVNTAGIGLVERALNIAPAQVRSGDVILLNGDIGRHGIAIMAVREGLSFETQIESDCAPLADLVGKMLAAGVEIHCMRDLTRGGLASAMVEIAENATYDISVEERAIPVREDVQGACEILGLDPLYVANEGRFIAFVPPSNADKALAVMRAHPLGAQACAIGRVDEGHARIVRLNSRIGTTRIVDMISGEQLPRIC
jgi:hydrogenase expression/formation protein HypE